MWDWPFSHIMPERPEDQIRRPGCPGASWRIPAGTAQVGAWRSLVAHLLWEQRVGSANLPAPTNTYEGTRKGLCPRLCPLSVSSLPCGSHGECSRRPGRVHSRQSGFTTQHPAEVSRGCYESCSARGAGPAGKCGGGIAWWNRLPLSERRQWIEVADSAVPADAWGARGPKFKSRRSDQSKKAIFEVTVVKSVVNSKNWPARGDQLGSPAHFATRELFRFRFPGWMEPERLPSQTGLPWRPADTS